MSPQASVSKSKVTKTSAEADGKPSTCCLLVLDSLGSIPERSKGFLSLLKRPNWRWSPLSLLLIGHRGLFLNFSEGTEENNVNPRNSRFPDRDSN
jgi:hypothetical protein